MKNDTGQIFHRPDFPSGTGAPYYMEVPTFSALIENIEKKSTV